MAVNLIKVSWMIPTRVAVAVSATVLTACTSITVEPVKASEGLTHACIQLNEKVLVGDFVPVLRDGLSRHGISSQVYAGGELPAECEFIITYTALRSWDLAPYLTHAEIRLERGGIRVAYAEYHLVGGGGFSLMKWKGTKAKMDPVIDEWLEQYRQIEP